MNRPATALSFHDPADEATCANLLPPARSMIESGKPISELSLNPGGLVVSTTKWGACDPNDCGTTKLHVEDCDGGTLHLTAEISEICEHCFQRQAENAGLRRLPPGRGSDALMPGCLLHTNDHSTTVIGRFGPLCYTYESTSPWGPAALGVQTCAELWAFFPRRMCPATPMTFSSRAAYP